jgi:hypothetical protein
MDDVSASAPEKRAHFRVDDVLPVIVRKVQPEGECTNSRVFRGMFRGLSSTILEETEENQQLPVALRRMLAQIDAKLNLILEKLFLTRDEFGQAERRPVCLSAAGVRLQTAVELAVGDMAEITVMVMTEGATWLVLYGRVARTVATDCGEREIAVAFLDMEEDVREILIRYTLQRQREIIRKERGYDE